MEHSNWHYVFFFFGTAALVVAIIINHFSKKQRRKTYFSFQNGRAGTRKEDEEKKNFPVRKLLVQRPFWWVQYTSILLQYTLIWEFRMWFQTFALHKTHFQIFNALKSIFSGISDYFRLFQTFSHRCSHSPWIHLKSNGKLLLGYECFKINIECIPANCSFLIRIFWFFFSPRKRSNILRAFLFLWLSVNSKAYEIHECSFFWKFYPYLFLFVGFQGWQVCWVEAW